MLNAFIDGEQIEYAQIGVDFLSWRTPNDIFLCIGERKNFRIIKRKLIPFTHHDASTIIYSSVYLKYSDEN